MSRGQEDVSQNSDPTTAELQALRQELASVREELKEKESRIKAIESILGVETSGGASSASQVADPRLVGLIPQVFPVPRPIEDALQAQWRVVYGHSAEQDLERGGLVLNDGTVNPGHCGFHPHVQLSPVSSIPDGEAGCGARVGSAYTVFTGWEHTGIVGSDPSSYFHSQSVFAHFHVHCDMARTCRGRKAASMPSLGDLKYWLECHFNMPKAFVLTLDSCWLFMKFQVPGHENQGFKAPDEVIAPFRSRCDGHILEELSAAPEIWEGLRPHGFGLYRKWINHRDSEGNGPYELVDVSAWRSSGTRPAGAYVIT
eukprot:TRINITY_DN112115_c0_g1_i1.p1 TRINITY_DN112115_c0_g1~~TRINITY_DN112115_c0_g1_i1.p1  ORF type:complete len:335 (-),score=41.57 TRINITY_DN112115_c0_g1_i1:49-990(-)